MEQAILSLQQNPTQEMLAHALTVCTQTDAGSWTAYRGRGAAGRKISRCACKAIQTDDGKKWWAAFTSFDEELKGGGSVMSTFLTDMEKLFVSALSVDEG